VTSASWSVVLRRIPEAMASTLPLAAVLSLAVLALIPTLYEWSHADAVAADPLLQQKSVWLNPTFFAGRTVFCGLLWLLFGAILVSGPRRREASGNAGKRRVAASGIFLALFAISFSVLTFDWIMSLEPHWFSTMFAVYNFAGLFLGGMAVVTLFVIVLRRTGHLDGIVTENHLHDLGKLMFSFSTFWAYIWFCQYMLIWYANIPEETSHFVTRQADSWNVVFLTNVCVNWAIPFFVLLPRGAKRRETTLLAIAILLIVGRWLDLYLMILPPFLGEEPHLGIWEILPVVSALSFFALAFFRALGKASILPPRSDPYLEESLHLHQ